MAKKADIRTCKFSDCCHETKDIDISSDPFIKVGRAYYHEDCFSKKNSIEKANEGIKTCRYSHCKHPEKKIDLSKDEHVKVNNTYYHKDCYQTKADIELIKNIWVEKIDPNVVHSQLGATLNRLIFEDGHPSAYVLFTLEYCIKNNRKLRYPPGLKYCVNNHVIKDAYFKSIKKKDYPPQRIIQSIEPEKVSSAIKEDDSPTFTINRKPTGFKSILGGKR